VTPAMLEVLHSLFSEVRRWKKRGEDIRARTHSPTHSLVTYRISSHSFTTLHHSLTHSHTHSHTYWCTHTLMDTKEYSIGDTRVSTIYCNLSFLLIVFVVYV
jgi:hypothetical protein